MARAQHPTACARALALAALLAAGACTAREPAAPAGGTPSQPAATPAPPPVAPPAPRLLDTAALDAAVKQNLQRGAIVALWATW